MKYIILGLLACFIICFIVIIILLKTKIKQERKYKEEYIEEEKKKWESAFKKEKAEYLKMVNQRIAFEENAKQRIRELDGVIAQKQLAVQNVIDALEEKKKAYEQSQLQYTESSKKVLDEQLHRHYDNEAINFELDLAKTIEELREAAQVEYEASMASMTKELGALQSELENYRQKRDAVNAEILRQRAIDEKQDFYRINLDQSSIDDIQVLNSIRKNLHHHDSLDKLIYDTYVAKPVQEMVKRVLEGGAPSGIYKITRLKTGEIYIGKSTDVKTRWIQHTKTAFGCGTIAHSILHTTMAKDGIENFTFELLEEVPKDRLTEREKYYISFYDSKKYGLNEREG